MHAARLRVQQSRAREIEYPAIGVYESIDGGAERTTDTCVIGTAERWIKERL